MRIYRFWREKVICVDDTPCRFRAGSNESPEHADTLIEKKIAWFHRWSDADGPISEEEIREMDTLFADGKTGMEYEVPIREEIVETLDENNIVTRNRYGALVLNSTTLTFIDIDSIAPSFGDLAGVLIGRKIPDVKDRILRHIESRAARGEYADLGFRVYETHRGIRLLLSAQMMPAYAFAVQRILYDFRADKCYATLCAKQNCYRARLTPKPARLRMNERFPSSFPYPEDKLDAVGSWIERYSKASENFATCNLLTTFGSPFHSPAIDYHDNACRIKAKLPLA